MNIPRQALTFCCMGLVCVFWTLFSLFLGQIWSKGKTIYRANDPFQFYTWICFFIILAAVFIGVGTFFILHPHASLIPTTHVSDE